MYAVLLCAFLGVTVVQRVCLSHQFAIQSVFGCVVELVQQLHSQLTWALPCGV